MGVSTPDPIRTCTQGDSSSRVPCMDSLTTSNLTKDTPMATSLTPTNITLISAGLSEALSQDLHVYMEGGSWATTTMAWDHNKALERDLTLSLRDRQGMVFLSSSGLTSNTMDLQVETMLFLPPACPLTSHLTEQRPSMAFPHLHHQIPMA